MAKRPFVIYGCPYTAFHATKDANPLLVSEPDSSLYHFASNSNRVLNLIGFSGADEVELIGCSTEFVDLFHQLLAKHPEARFRVNCVPKTVSSFGEGVRLEPGVTDAIVVEKQPSAIPIGYQLAKERNAELITIDPISEDEVASFLAGWRDFEDTNGLARQNGLDACCDLIEKKLGAEFLSRQWASITCITKIPLNLYPFHCPTGHLPIHAAGVLSVAGRLKGQATSLQTGVAVLLDSGKTQMSGASEWSTLRESLSGGYGILPPHACADLSDFRFLIEDIPADLIFLTAHCGRIPLTELSASFRFQGQESIVRYAVDRNISVVPRSGVVEAGTVYVPLEVNGVSWKANLCDRKLFLRFSQVEMDASLGMHPKDRAFANVVVQCVADGPPRELPAKCIGCGDGQHFLPLTHTIGDYHFPLVFNNSCASYSGVCEEFLPDVSFYVGSTRPINSFQANEVITKFVQNLPSMTVGTALFEAQRGFVEDHTPYLLAGVPWASMPQYGSRSIAIMKANQILKGARTDDPRATNARLLFREQQRKTLLKQLFDTPTAVA
jgi:hypothetical protein